VTIFWVAVNTGARNTPVTLPHELHKLRTPGQQYNAKQVYQKIRHEKEKAKTDTRSCDQILL
jgi:phage-related tail protein